jgi:hypothetical protein
MESTIARQYLLSIAQGPKGQKGHFQRVRWINRIVQDIKLQITVLLCN